MVNQRLDSLIGIREDWLSGAAILALLLPALHPLARGTLGVGSHLLWILHVFPAAVFAYRYGRRGAAVLLPLVAGIVDDPTTDVDSTYLVEYATEKLQRRIEIITDREAQIPPIEELVHVEGGRDVSAD